jgi:hypothetical protein
MARAMYLPIPPDVDDALSRLAEQELRHPKDQATVLLMEGLRQRGMLAPEPPSQSARPEASHARTH